MIAPETTTLTIDWMLEATCRNEGIPTSLFFSEDLGEIAQAKAICATCPAMVPCLEGAIARAEPWGVWGGQLLLERQGPRRQAASWPAAQAPSSRGRGAHAAGPGAPQRVRPQRVGSQRPRSGPATRAQTATDGSGQRSASPGLSKRCGQPSRSSVAVRFRRRWLPVRDAGARLSRQCVQRR